MMRSVFGGWFEREYGGVLLCFMFVGRDLDGAAKNATEALTSRGRSRSRSEWGDFSVARG